MVVVGFTGEKLGHGELSKSMALRTSADHLLHQDQVRLDFGEMVTLDTDEEWAVFVMAIG